MSQRRNDPCSCGSGLKYKNCCENQPTRTQWTRYAAGVALALVVAVGLVMAIMDWAGREPGPPQGPAPDGKIWSEEHGHWHDAPQPPPGPPPPGKVWSAEHGHYHDAQGGTAAAGAPQGAPPPGKVWSEEHGHYHDAPAGTAPAQPADPLDDYGTSSAPVSPAPADANG